MAVRALGLRCNAILGTDVEEGPMKVHSTDLDMVCSVPVQRE